MQPIVKAALLCDYALTSDDGKLSAIGMFANINFPQLPNSYPRFFVVIIVALNRGSHIVRLGIVDPIGNQVLPEQPEVHVEVEAPGSDTNLVIDFNNLPFSRAGIHQVQLFVSDLLVHSVPLVIGIAGGDMFGPSRGN